MGGEKCEYGINGINEKTVGQVWIDRNCIGTISMDR